MIKVYAPASIGNIGVGFDLLGIAVASLDDNLLGDCVSIETSNIFNVEQVGCFSNQLPEQMEKNIVFQCWRRFCDIVGRKYPPIFIQLEKNIPVSSGLGSSACSIVATLVAINHHFDCPLNNSQLFRLMGEIEGNFSGSIHFDNISPCFFGGMQLVIQECNIISQTVPVFDNWFWVLAYPGIKLSTSVSRAILPKKYSRMDCINYGRYLSSFIHACYTQQEFLAIQCMRDIIAEPYRSQLLPIQLSDVRRVLIEKGAVSCGISGSGPTIFALCKSNNIANSVSLWLSQYYLQSNTGFVRICKVDNIGVRILVNDK